VPLQKLCPVFSGSIDFCSVQPKDFGARYPAAAGRRRRLAVALHTAISVAPMGRAAIFVATDVIGQRHVIAGKAE